MSRENCDVAWEKSYPNRYTMTLAIFSLSLSSNRTLLYGLDPWNELVCTFIAALSHMMLLYEYLQLVLNESSIISAFKAGE